MEVKKKKTQHLRCVCDGRERLICWSNLDVLSLTSRISSRSGVIFSVDLISLDIWWRKHFINLAFMELITDNQSQRLPSTHPNVILAQTLPDAIRFGIYRYDNMVDGLGDRVLPLQIHPCWEVHDALRQLLHIKWMQSCWTNNHLGEMISANPNHSIKYGPGVL